MRRAGVGVIGCGFMGAHVHLPALKSIPGAEIVAVSSRDAKKGKKIMKKFKAKSHYTRYLDLIEDPRVDAVFVCLPTFLHAQTVVDAAKAGKHIFCELPLALTLEDTDRIINAARKAGILLMPGQVLRFTPNYVRAKELIDQDLIGKPILVSYQELISAAVLARQWPPESWVWQKEKSRGLLFTVSVFALDLLRWLLNTEIERVYSTEKTVILKEFGNIQGFNAAIVLNFTSGAIGLMEYSSLVVPEMETNRLEVSGKKRGRLSATGNDALALFGVDPHMQRWTFREGGTKAWGHHQEDEHFIECILQDREPVVTAEDARKAQEIAVAIMRANEEGRPSLIARSHR
jgi:predicted dehydrogenase